jgi:hypothetical protein
VQKAAGTKAASSSTQFRDRASGCLVAPAWCRSKRHM